MRALWVISWDEERLAPWVASASPEMLVGAADRMWEAYPIDPVVVEAMESLTMFINHNNTVAAGHDKDDVVATLLALHDAGLPLDGEALSGWAAAHGWAGSNPAQLEKYVEAINHGSRPRSRLVLGADYVNRLREKVESKQQ